MENQNIKNEEVKGELTLFSGVKQNVYCSKVAETEKDKKAGDAIQEVVGDVNTLNSFGGEINVDIKRFGRNECGKKFKLERKTD